MAVIGGEGDRENVVGVSDKSSGGGTAGKLPKAESLVPGGREGIGTVGGDDLYLIISRPSPLKADLADNLHSQRQCGSDRGENA